MKPNEYYSELDLAALVGASVDAYAQDDGYWHLFVALRLANGHAVVFSTDEQCAGPRFEVFPIAVQYEVDPARTWRALSTPMTIQSVTPLWRNEWIVPGAVASTVGIGPATQYAGRGPASENATASARVLAGVLISGSAGHKMVIAASDSAPFNVEIFLPGKAAERALDDFEPI